MMMPTRREIFTEASRSVRHKWVRLDLHFLCTFMSCAREHFCCICEKESLRVVDSWKGNFLNATHFRRNRSTFCAAIYCFVTNNHFRTFSEYFSWSGLIVDKLATKILCYNDGKVVSEAIKNMKMFPKIFRNFCNLITKFLNSQLNYLLHCFNR